MAGITSDHPFLNFSDNFKFIPLCTIENDELRTNLISFLTSMNSEPDEGDSKTLIYGTSHCHWMVGHGIQHSRDVWVIANRFFDSYKNLKGLPPLNDKEKYCLSCAIWLHDIGMSTMMAPIGGQIGRLKGFWNGKTI